MTYFRQKQSGTKNPTAQQTVLDTGWHGINHAIKTLCKTNFLVFQKVELGFELGPQHTIWWNHLQTKEDVCEMAPRDHGKLLVHTEPVLTTKGWKTHGTLGIGDKVFTPDGNQREIIGLSEEDEATLKITLSTGKTIKVHPNHEWEVVDRKTRRAVGKRQAGVKQAREYITRVIETKQMLTEGLSLGGKDGRDRFWLKRNSALRFSPKEAPIHPYVMGIWLGDGDKYGRWICQGEADAETIFNGVEENEVKEKEYIHSGTGVISRTYLNFRKRIQDLGLEGEKRILPIYQRASIKQRLDLLAGLIDSDGCVEQVKQRNRPVLQRVRFVNTNKQLIDDVEELCRGLGFGTSIDRAEPTLSSSGVQGRLPVFTIRITPTLDVPCRLERKKIKGGSLPNISIRSIEPCEPEPGRCIEIDDPRGVYLVGRELIPTHNSHSLARAYPIWKIKYDPWVKEVLILGADQPSAVENLDKIKEILSNHPKMTNLLPKGRFDGANSRTEVRLTNGKTIKAKGIGSPLRGRHPQLIVLDDVLNERNSWSADSRRDLQNYFNEVVVPMKDKGLPKDRALGYKSQIVVIGTAQDYGDLYHYLQENGEYVGEKLTAITDYENQTVLWPERYSYEDLIGLKRRVGSLSFAKEYQNDPMTDETTIFPSTLFTQLFDKDLEYTRNYTSGNPVYIGVDFSIPGNTDGDWTVIVAIEYNPSANLYTLLNYWRARPSNISEQLKQIEYYCQVYNVTLGYLEDNMFQGIYREHFRKNSNLPLRGHTVTHSGKKSMEHGIISLRPIFENSLFRFPYKTENDVAKTDMIVSEFNGIQQRHGRIGNETTHDDIVLALWHAVCASRQTRFEADFG